MARKGALGSCPLHNFLARAGLPLGVTPRRTSAVTFWTKPGDGKLGVARQGHFVTSLGCEGSCPVPKILNICSRKVFFPQEFVNLGLTALSLGPAAPRHAAGLVLPALLQPAGSEMCPYIKGVCFFSPGASPPAHVTSQARTELLLGINLGF